jgi:DNA-binding LacI/PurR family transcriptional regulator
VIVCYTAQQDERVRAILSDLQQADADNVVLIDARSDNKPSASRA